jgi:hypothetical protein
VLDRTEPPVEEVEVEDLGQKTYDTDQKEEVIPNYDKKTDDTVAFSEEKINDTNNKKKNRGKKRSTAAISLEDAIDDAGNIKESEEK